ncbi:sulfate reduction electron transfer complex DsrMKJOP subunit DsrK [Desulforudis sp. 1031]|uniref:sulfate reduction electron transfer complex DsrMKJOP subunit DsrK n=2 Tax=Candidatus Desulforudis TaxID=471826 RepID=UPI003CE93521
MSANALRQPKKANEALMRSVGCDPVPDDKKVEAAIQHIDEFRKKVRSFVMAMESCVKCGLCAENCHTYLGTKDPYNIPANRADLIRKVYKRYFTVQGRLFGGLVGAEELTLEMLEKWYSYFYQCSECRRCGHTCPFGIDTCEVTMVGRQILYWLGIGPQLHTATAGAILKTGNHMGLTKAGIEDTLEFLAEEIKDDYGIDVEFPVDKPESDILYIPSSADFMLNPGTLKGAAMFFKYVGANWTMTSRMTEAGNFGYLMDQNRIQRELVSRLFEEAVKLGVKKIVWGECGHGWRAAKMYIPTMSDYVGSRRIPITHIHDEVAALIEAGKLKLDPTRNSRKVTLHDPCNYVRACGHCDVMRTVIRAVTTDFVEMTPYKEQNFCCGGGSGILFDDPDMYQYRIQASQKKADQVRATGAEILCAPCSICKAQLYPMVKEHKLPVEVHGLIDLVGNALVWD